MLFSAVLIYTISILFCMQKFPLFKQSSLHIIDAKRQKYSSEENQPTEHVV